MSFKFFAVFIIMLFSLWSGISLGNSLASYRESGSQALDLTRKLTNYNNEQALIIEKLKLKPTPKERAILLGLFWLIGFIDSDTNFEFLGVNLFMLLHELLSKKERKNIQEVAEPILTKSLKRATQKLELMFPANNRSLWQFIALLPILEKYPELKTIYHNFYQQNFAQHALEAGEEDKEAYTKALRDKSYRIIYDYLIGASFLYYYLQNTKEPIANLPKDNFLKSLKELESLEYDLKFKSREKIIDLGYLATHVILVLTNYGEYIITNSLNKQKAMSFISYTMPYVRNKLGYLDLLAEYIQCIKINNSEDNKNINNLEQLLIDFQHSDGSWGNEQSARSDPYTAFHPTWAVLSALNQ